MNNAERKIDELVLGFWRLLDWQITPQQCLAFLEQAIEAGVRHTDHADIYGGYGCEAEFGKTLALKPSIRDEIRIITKCGIKPAFASLGLAGQANHYDSSAAHIISSAQQSLKHFNTDRLDALLIHRPDYLMNADEVAEAFTTLKRNGDVLLILNLCVGHLWLAVAFLQKMMKKRFACVKYLSKSAAKLVQVLLIKWFTRGY